MWSPRLDELGNSVRGIEFCRKLVAEYNVHVFDSLVTGRGRGAKRESPVQYDGRGQVYMEFGHCQVARLDLTFAAGRPLTGTFEAPSIDLTGRKSEFVTTRIQRWLGRGAGRRQ